MQRTLILLKPDAVRRGLVGDLTARFERKGLKLVAMKMLTPTGGLAEAHYAVHKGKVFYDSLVQFLAGGPLVAQVWEGREAIAACRMMIGATDGVKASPGTIRGDYATVVQENLVHGSDSPEAAVAEIDLWFGQL